MAFRSPEQENYLEYRMHLSNKEKKILIGKFYDSIELFHVEKNKTIRAMREIKDFELLQKPDYIWDGWALLLDDGYWRFGCTLQGRIYLQDKKTSFDCSKFEAMKTWD